MDWAVEAVWLSQRMWIERTGGWEEGYTLKEATGDSAEVGNDRNKNGRVKENLASSCWLGYNWMEGVVE